MRAVRTLVWFAGLLVSNFFAYACYDACKPEVLHVIRWMGTQTIWTILASIPFGIVIYALPVLGVCIVIGCNLFTAHGTYAALKGETFGLD